MFDVRRIYRGVLVGGLMLSSLGLSGCADIAIGAAAVTFYKREDVNLVEKSYAAADYILQKSNTYYDRYTPIVVVPLIDADRTELSSKFGRTIGNQIGSRFGQLGYNVDLSQVRLSEGDAGFQAKPSKDAPKIALSGTYKRQRPDMEVNLYVTEIESGFRIAAFQYLIPYHSDIRKMSEPEIRIMRVH